MMAISDEAKEQLRQAAVRLLNNAWLMQTGRFPADLDVVLNTATKELERWLQDSEVITEAHTEILLAFEKQFQHQIIMHFSVSQDKTAFEYNGGNLLSADVDFEIDEVFDKIGDGLFGDLFAIEQAIPFASAGIVPGGTEEKITFDLERFGKQLTCIVTMYANCYRVSVNGRDYGSIEMDDEEAWVQRSGVSMPQDLVETIGRLIEHHDD